KEIGRGAVDSNGKFKVELDKPLIDGEEIRVNLVNGGKTSPETVINAPNLPLAKPEDLEFNADGSEVFGKGRPGSTVIIKDKAGKEIGRGTVDSNGKFKVELDKPLIDGEEIKVNLVNGGKTSPETVINAPNLPLAKPEDLEFNADGSQITGKGRPGSTVIIKDKAGKEIGRGTVDSNGKFRVELENPLTDGEEVKVNLVNDSKNSPNATINAPNIPLEGPEDVEFSSDGSAITGIGKPGATVVVKDEGGQKVGEGIVNPDGKFTVNLDKPFVDGEKVKVNLVEGNKVSSDVTITAPIKAWDITDVVNEDAYIATFEKMGTRKKHVTNADGHDFTNFAYPGKDLLFTPEGEPTKDYYELEVYTKGLTPDEFKQGSIALKYWSVSNNKGSYLEIETIDFNDPRVKMEEKGDYTVVYFSASDFMDAKKIQELKDNDAFFGENTHFMFTYTAGFSVDRYRAVNLIRYKPVIDPLESEGNYLKESIISEIGENDLKVTKVNGQKISSQGVKGEYGTLFMEADGAYTYKPNGNINNIGHTDRFEITVSDSKGIEVTKELGFEIKEGISIEPSMAPLSLADTEDSLLDEVDQFSDEEESREEDLTDLPSLEDLLSLEADDLVPSLEDSQGDETIPKDLLISDNNRTEVTSDNVIDLPPVVDPLEDLLDVDKNII
ncbi:Ig-like domain-containing protein, partial [Ignatzschineria indica]